MITLAQKLDLLLEDNALSPLDGALDVAEQLREAEDAVKTLKRRFEMAVDRINGDLAMGIRRVQPGLHVVLDKQGCKVGYKSKSLIFYPNLTDAVWRVNGLDSRFLNKFNQINGPIPLKKDLGRVTKAIIDYFNKYYKSLHEEIVGTGVLLIDGKQSTCLDLSNWRQANSGFLND